MPIKYRLVLIFITAITGVYIPTSMMGLTIHNGFFAKQQLNCIEDTSAALVNMLDGYESADQAKKSEDILHGLKACLYNLDYNKGLVTSVREEVARERSTRNP